MIDARLGNALPALIASMPPRSAVVVRPYAIHAAGRAGALRAIRRAARAKRHLLLLAGGGALAGYDGRHGHGHRGRAHFLSAPVHDRRELHKAARAGADAILVSPVLPTRSHPGAASLGRQGFARLAHGSRASAIALGGIDAAAFKRLRFSGAWGWAGIDAWAAHHATRQRQKRNCVPT